MKISYSLEEYLRIIYILEKKNKNVRVTDIANILECSKPSVTRAINSLKEEKLINYETYGNIELTEEGINTAKKIIRRYDVLKMFLTHVLEIDEKTAEKEATVMKHSISEETSEKLDKYIREIMDIKDLACCYDEHSEKCKKCAKVRVNANKVGKNK